MANQPKLFETSQTAQMLSGLSAYQALTERQQDVVRAYIDAHGECAGRIRQKEWLAKAQEYGVSRSRFYEILKEAPQNIWAAITAALQYTGEQAAQYGALALYTAGLRLYEQIMAGERTTSALTSVELGIMKECVNSLSPARVMAFAAKDGSGRSVQGAVAKGSGGQQDNQDLESQAASIVGALQAEIGLRGGDAETSPAGSEASEAESVRSEADPPGDVAQEPGGGSAGQEGSTGVIEGGNAGEGCSGGHDGEASSKEDQSVSADAALTVGDGGT